MISVKNSFEIAYNGTENECRFELYADTASDLQGLTHIDGIKIQMGSECTDIATGDKYILNGSGAWILQPKDNAFTNVYTKAEIDNMSNVIYQTMLYYHSAQESSDGSITFYTLGTPVGSLTIYGNGQQTGTPTPDNPVMPEFVGVRTGNLFYSDRTTHNTTASSTIDQTEGSSEFVISKSETSSTVALTAKINLPLRAGTYTVSVDGLSFIAGNLDRINLRKSDGVVVNNVMTGSPQTFTIDTDTVVTGVAFICDSTSTYTNRKVRVMLNTGSTALPYEPFGWAEKITCAGQTTPVYLGQVSTVRKIGKLVLTGEENWLINEAVSTEDTAYFYTTAIATNTYVAGYGICSHFEYKDAYNIRDVNGFHLLSGYDGLRFRIMRTIAGTVANFKTYLAQQYAAGTPVTVWYVIAEPTTGIVNEPLCKIGTYADELHSTDAAVTIPTVSGENTLTVDTDLIPSKIVISGGE